jgi:hypothetical protein
MRIASSIGSVDSHALPFAGDRKRHSADHLGLIDQARAASLHKSDPAQTLAFHDRQAHQLL